MGAASIRRRLRLQPADGGVESELLSVGGYDGLADSARRKDGKMLLDDELDRLVMVPGPTPVHRVILDAIGQPTMWHGDAAMADVVRACQQGLRELCTAQESQVFIFGGSGTLAQEAAVINLVGPGERLLVVSNGFFGDRFVAIAERYGIEVDRLTAPWGESVEPSALADRLSTRKYRAVTLTHVDTSTGVAAPVESLAREAKKHGVLVLLDTVCSLGGMPVRMAEWGIDVVLCGAQKALGVPPGLVLLLTSPEGMERRREMGSVSAYYADLLNWEASMADPQVYFSTHAVNLFYALQAGLALIREEGLERRIERHQRLATEFRAGMGALGFASLASRRWTAPTMSVLAYPGGVEDGAFRAALAGHGVVAAGAIGEFKGRGIRFGHMGNVTRTEILQTIGAVESALADCGVQSAPGAGLQAVEAATRPALAATP